MRYIECTVKNEFVSGAGQVIGAAGSHHDVALRLTFGEMWDELSMYVTFRDALGENPTVVQILPTSLVLGTESTYDVVVPAAPKAKQGKAMVTVQGYTVVNGTQEATATNTATAYFVVLPSDHALADDESIDATMAQQLQTEIDEIKETITDARLAAKDAEAWAVGQIEGADVPETDERYENNSKYYAQRADESATEAFGYKSAAFGSATAAAGSAATANQKAQAAANSARDAAASKTFVEQRIQDGLDRGLLIVKSLTATLRADGWSATAPYTQTITLPEGSMTADQDGGIHLAEGATAEQVAAETDAVLMPTAQAADSVTVTAYGVKPTIDLPVELHLNFNDESLLDEVYAQLLGLDNALRFSAASAFTLVSANQAKNWDGTIEYTDGRSPWVVWDGTTTLTSGSDNKLYLRGTGNTIITGGSSLFYGNGWWITGAEVSCRGNIETLLDYATVAAGNHPTMGVGCFRNLFNGSWIVNSPELPAVTLAERCYREMFFNSRLTTPPELPATVLANGCYEGMFNSCIRLTDPPELPATALAERCYAFMFHDCTGLTSAPELPATALAEECYYSMFQGCPRLAAPPELPATTLTGSCYMYMFEDCTGLAALPELPAATLAEECYFAMFAGCTGLKLSETQDSVYRYPYRIPSSGTGIDAEDALNIMFKDTGGTFTGTPTINTTYYTDHEPVGA